MTMIMCVCMRRCARAVAYMGSVRAREDPPSTSPPTPTRLVKSVCGTNICLGRSPLAVPLPENVQFKERPVSDTMSTRDVDGVSFALGRGALMASYIFIFTLGIVLEIFVIFFYLVIYFLGGILEIMMNIRDDN